MGGSSSSAGGGISEAVNSLASDSLLKITDAICEGQISGFAYTSGQYGWDPLTATYFNNIVVRNADGSYNFNISGQGFQFSWTLGESGQTPMSGFEHVTVPLPLPQDTRLANPPQNAGLPKQLLVSFNTNQYPDAASILVNFRIPQMYTTDQNGNINGFEVDAQIDISLNNGPFVPLSDPIAFVGKNTSPYFRTYQFSLPFTTPPESFYQWTLKIYKTSIDVLSAMTVGDIYVDSVSIISASQYSYPNTALVGLYIDALQFGTVPARAYLIQGTMINVPNGYTPTKYDPNTSTITPAVYPDIWDGTFAAEKVWTDNPAWIFCDILTNNRYGLGQYLNEMGVDIWTLYQLSQYCDRMVDNGLGNGGLEPQFTINKFIKDADEAYNVLLNIASAFRGMIYYANGTIRANTTDDQSPVFDYTNANVIDGNFSYSSSSRSARHNSVQVKYSDPYNLYRDNYVVLEDNASIIQFGFNKKDIEAFGCTSPGMATRIANWILTTERLRTETVTFQVGQDGLFIRPGDVFNLYDNFRMNRNQGGRVASFDSSEQFITLDRPVNLDSGCIYSLSCIISDFNFDNSSELTGSNQIPFIRNPQIQTCLVLNADISGLSTLQVSGGFSGLSKDAVWVLSATGSYTSGYVPTVFEQAPQYQCLGISETQPGIYGIVALNYNTGINYSINTGFSAIFNPINSGNNVAPLPITNLTGQLITGNLSNNSFYTYLNLTWSPSLSSDVSFYEISSNATGPTEPVGTTTSTGFNYISPVTGNVTFFVESIGKGGAASAPQNTTFFFAPPPGITSIDPSGIRFWSLPAGFGDLEQVAVFYNRPYPSITNTFVNFATGIVGAFRTVLDTTFYPAEGVSQSGLSLSGTTVFFNSTSYDMSQMVSQTASQQANNSLLFLVDDELMSVGTITGEGNGNFAFTVSRGVLGTFNETHNSNISGWMFYSADIQSFSDSSLVHVNNATGYDTGIATRYFTVQNNTSVIDGKTLPVFPYIAYTLPNPAPAAPTNLTVQSGSGKIIRLLWTPPENENIIGYNIYRATGAAFASTGVIANTVNTFYDDINVNLGTTYEYLVTAVNQEEQESPFSNSVYATPQFILPSGINPYPPGNPSGISLASSGTYLAADGTLLSSLTFIVSGLPTGAAYQNIIYSRHSISGLASARVGIQLSNPNAVFATIFDLTPNTSYDVGVQAISNFGVFSNAVTGSNSPYLAPQLPASPGGAGSAPNIVSGFMASGGLGGTANFIALSWLSNAELNLEEYGLYKNTINSQPTSPFAYAGTNSFVDATVTGGVNYFYWIDAINRNEQASAATGPVTASTENPPSPPSAATLNASGFYLSSDGNVFNYLTFNVAAIPAGAVGQYLLYRIDGSANWSVGNDLNNISSTTATLNDLTPGTIYDVGIQAYSINGISTSVVTGLNSDYTAFGKNTAPLPMTNLSARGANTGDSIIPTYYFNDASFGLTSVTVVTWTPSMSNDIAYQYYTLTDRFFDVVFSGRLPAAQSSFNLYQGGAITDSFFGFSGFAVDRNGNMSNPVGLSAIQIGGSGIFSSLYAGNLGAQNYNSTQLYGVQIGNVSATSVQQVLTSYPINTIVIVTGATSAQQILNIDLTNRGFSTRPDTCSTNVLNLSNVYNLNYDWSDSTSTNAVMYLNTTNGSTIASGTAFQISMDFTEYT